MSLQLPSQVVWFLNLIGVSWPDVDEDQVRLFGQHVRDFGNNINSTHEAASSTIKQMGASYQGASYEQLVQIWAGMSNNHMTELVDSCGVVATALDVAADAIVAAKGVAIGELVTLAATFAADQAAAVETLGLAEAALPALITAAKRVTKGLIDQLEQHIVGEVIEEAVAPLEQVVERALGGLVFTGLEAALGAPSTGGSGAVGSSVSIVPEALHGHAATLQGHADEVSAHATRFANSVSGLSFGG